MFKKVCTNIINIIFALITGFLFIASLSTHCEIDTESFLQLKHLVSHRAYVYLPLSILFTTALVILYQFLHNLSAKNEVLFQKVRKIVTIATFSLIIGVSLFWIFFNDTVPHSDQAILFQEAQKLSGYSKSSYNTFYFGAYDRQRGIVTLMALLLKLFGNNQITFRFYNVLMLGLLLLGIKLLLDSFIKDDSAGIITLFLLLFFYPIIIYTCYLYGTLSAVTFEIFGFYGILKLIETRQYKYTLLSAICFALGAFMHQSALIGLIAGCVLLIIKVNKKSIIQYLLSIFIIFAVYIGSNYLISYSFSKFTGCPNGDALPATATIYMGLTATEESGALSGPGSSDAAEMILYQRNDNSASDTNKEAVYLLQSVIKEYRDGTRSLDFFIQKIKYQWLEPTFDAHRIILLNNAEENEPANSEAYTRFYYSNLRDIFPKLLLILLIVIYSFACIGSIVDMFRKDTNLLNTLIRLFFIGGFTFQILWESLSRYCFSYYIFLIIEAVWGITGIIQLRKSK